MQRMTYLWTTKTNFILAQSNGYRAQIIRREQKNNILGHTPWPCLKDHERANFHCHPSGTLYYRSDTNLGKCGTSIITLGSVL